MNTILKCLFFVVGFAILFIGFVICHENTHKLVYEYYGINSDISYFTKGCWDDGAIACTTPNYENVTLDEQTINSIIQTQSMNEIVSYPIIFILLLNYSILFWIIQKEVR